MRSESQPDRYYVAFAGSAKGRGLLPLAGTDHALTGLFFVLDASRPRPIVRLSPVSEQWTPTEYAYDIGLEDKEIITWDSRY